MTYLKMSDWEILDFDKSTRKNKKYMVAFKNKKDNTNIKILHFGAKGYEQYFDSTPLSLYTHLNHNDEERRKNYVSRHKGFIKKGYYSPGWLSMKYLW